MVGLKEIFQVRTISIFTLTITTIFFLASICYEKGYVNVGDKLEVFGSWLKGYKNYKTNIHTVDACIQLCKQYGQCQWWNYDPDQKACWLKKGQGFPKELSKYENFYTGHRDSTEECPKRFVPTGYQQQEQASQPDDINDSNTTTIEENNNDDSSRFTIQNPCPDGKLELDCEHGGGCVGCCTGELPGSDGTPVCPADADIDIHE